MSTHKQTIICLGAEVHTCVLSTQEAETKEPQVETSLGFKGIPHQLGLYSKLYFIAL